jgi:hypothetical protein
MYANSLRQMSSEPPKAAAGLIAKTKQMSGEQFPAEPRRPHMALMGPTGSSMHPWPASSLGRCHRALGISARRRGGLTDGGHRPVDPSASPAAGASGTSQSVQPRCFFAVGTIQEGAPL